MINKTKKMINKTKQTIENKPVLKSRPSRVLELALENQSIGSDKILSSSTTSKSSSSRALDPEIKAEVKKVKSILIKRDYVVDVFLHELKLFKAMLKKIDPDYFIELEEKITNQVTDFLKSLTTASANAVVKDLKAKAVVKDSKAKVKDMREAVKDMRKAFKEHKSFNGSRAVIKEFSEKYLYKIVSRCFGAVSVSVPVPCLAMVPVPCLAMVSVPCLAMEPVPVPEPCLAMIPAEHSLAMIPAEHSLAMIPAEHSWAMIPAEHSLAMIPAEPGLEVTALSLVWRLQQLNLVWRFLHLNIAWRLIKNRKGVLPSTLNRSNSGSYSS